jgi:mono/diheme cytochrome c family protein
MTEGGTVFTILTSLAIVPASAGADEGRAIYVAKCQSCHGTEGRGDGPAARALPKRPQDMTDAGFWTANTDEQVKSIVVQGKPGSIMRGFPMPDNQLADLMAYLKSLQASDK